MVYSHHQTNIDQVPLFEEKKNLVFHITQIFFFLLQVIAGTADRSHSIDEGVELTHEKKKRKKKQE